MKKFTSFVLVGVLILSLAACGNKNSTGNEAQDSANMQGYAMPMLPPNNLELQAENDYPYMGVKFNVPDQLKEMADTNQMFITTEGKLSEVQAMTYSVVSFHFIAED